MTKTVSTPKNYCRKKEILISTLGFLYILPVSLYLSISTNSTLNPHNYLVRTFSFSLPTDCFYSSPKRPTCTLFRVLEKWVKRLKTPFVYISLFHCSILYTRENKYILVYFTEAYALGQGVFPRWQIFTSTRIYTRCLKKMVYNKLSQEKVIEDDNKMYLYLPRYVGTMEWCIALFIISICAIVGWHEFTILRNRIIMAKLRCKDSVNTCSQYSRGTAVYCFWFCA